MQIIFYNQHQHGDILLSRQGIRWIIDNSPKYIEYFYLHNKNPESVFVHDKIEPLTVDFDFHDMPMKIMQNNFSKNNLFSDALWVSSWLGSLNGMRIVIDSDGRFRYLLPTENGEYIIGQSYEIWDNLYTQHMLCKQNIGFINEFLLLNFSNFKIPYPEQNDLLIKWNSKPKKLQEINNLLKNNFKVRILICNGDTISQQRENFNYENYLKDFFHKYKDVAFYLTENKNNINLPNVFYLNDYIKVPNLNEIEYLSAFCDIIVTSLSGPGCSVINDKTMNDPNKTMIYICRKKIGFIYDNGSCEYIQTENYSVDNIQNIVEKAIEKRLK